jgi:hypothetical protein
MRKDSVTITDKDLIVYDVVESDKHFEHHTDSFVHLMTVLRKFYPESVDELKIVETDSFIKQMSNILQNFCTQNNLPQYDPDDLLCDTKISLTDKQQNFLFSYKNLWNKGEV